MKTKGTIGDKKLHNLLNELEAGLKKIYRSSLKRIILYGSFAREQPEPGSDIDVMVLLSLNEKDIVKYDEAVLELTVDLTTSYGILVSVVKNNIDFFEAWSDTLPYFTNVKTVGIALYG